MTKQIYTPPRHIVVAIILIVIAVFIGKIIGQVGINYS